MKTHVLKTWPEFYRQIVCGEKTAELRKNDRDFQRGDTLHLLEFDPTRARYTGHTTRVAITAVLSGFAGLQKGYCVLSIRQDYSASRFVVKLAGRKTIPKDCQELGAKS